MSTKILSIDPGGTIGYAQLTIKKNKLIGLLVSQQKSDEEHRIFGSIPMQLVEWANIVVIEDFIGAGPRTKESKYTIKQIGAVEQEALRLGKKFVIQAPALRRKYIKMGCKLYEELTGGKICRHGMDALAHGLRFVANQFDPGTWLERKEK